MRREPFSYVLLTFVGGIYLVDEAKEVGILLFLIALIVGFYRKVKKNNLLLFAFVFLGYLRMQVKQREEPLPYELQQSYTNELKIGRILSPSKKYQRAYAEVISWNTSDSTSQKTQIKILGYFPLASNLREGSLCLTEAYFSGLYVSKNPHQFDYSRYLRRRGIRHVLFVQQMGLIKERPQTIFQKTKVYWGNKLKSSSYSDRTKSLLNTFFMGDKKHLDRSFLQNFRELGLAHLLVVSGFHVGLLFGLFHFFFRLFLKKVWASNLSVLLLWVYAFFVDFTPSVNRAVVMLTIYTVSVLLKRRQTGHHIWAMTAFTLLVIEPNYLYDVGFQLSFSAVFFIIWLVPFFKRKTPKRYQNNSFFQFGELSLSAQAGTSPLLLYYFGSFSYLSPLVNLLLLPPLSLAIGFYLLGGMALFFGLEFPWLMDSLSQGISKLGDLNRYNQGAMTSFYLDEIMVAMCFLFLWVLGRKSSVLKNKKIKLLGVLLFIQSYSIIDLYQKSNKKTQWVFYQKEGFILGYRQGLYLDLYVLDLSRINEKNPPYFLQNFIKKERIRQVNYFPLVKGKRKQWGKLRIKQNKKETLVLDEKKEWNIQEKGAYKKEVSF